MTWRSTRSIVLTAACVAAATSLAGCAGSAAHSPPIATQTPGEVDRTTAPSTTAIPAAANRTLVALLPELARGHDDKIKLGWYMTSFLRKVDPAVDTFGHTLMTENRELLDQLKKAAKNDHVSIEFKYGTSPADDARKLDEAAQQRVIRADDNADFQRDVLLLMYMDHQWELAIAQTIAKTQVPPDIKAYLDREITSRQSRIAEIRALLARYKWQ
jgi:hypothetical protein